MPVSPTENWSSTLSPARAHERPAERDLPAVRELGRVRQEVREDLPEPKRIAAKVVRDLRRDRRHERDPLVRDAVRDERAGVVEDAAERELRLLDLELPRLDLREVEDVVDHAEERGPRGVDLRDVVALPRRELRLQREPRHPDDRVHRRADLVAHVGEEVALGDVRGLGSLARLLELRRPEAHLLFERLPLVAQERIERRVAERDRHLADEVGDPDDDVGVRDARVVAQRVAIVACDEVPRERAPRAAEREHHELAQQEPFGDDRPGRVLRAHEAMLFPRPRRAQVGLREARPLDRARRSSEVPIERLHAEATFPAARQRHGALEVELVDRDLNRDSEDFVRLERPLQPLADLVKLPVDPCLRVAPLLGTVELVLRPDELLHLLVQVSILGAEALDLGGVGAGSVGVVHARSQ